MCTLNRKIERNSTIELLKLILFLGVIILHLCGGYGKAIELGGGCIDLQLLRSFFICAVDCFIIISGYYLSSSNRRNISKVINLYALAVLFHILLKVVGVGFGADFSLRSFLGAFVVGNYFLLLYIAVYLSSPFVNIVIENISKASFKLLLLLMFLLFSLYPTLIEYLFGHDESLIGYSFVSFFDGDGHGYTLVLFLFMYIIGAFIRKFGMPFKRKRICGVIIVLSSLVIALIMHYINKIELNYFSPVCILGAVALFNLFALIKPTRNKIINYLSSAVFGVYIVHLSVISQIRKFISIEDVVNNPIYIRLLGILLYSFIVFIISLLISIILNYIIDKTLMPILAKFKALSYEVK